MNEHYEALRRPPQEALRTIEFGALKGKSDINPQWKYEAMTEEFGLCGIGWKFEIADKETVPVTQTGEMMIFVVVNLYVKDGESWSAPIPGCGGDFLIKRDKNGMHGNDEGLKMAITDALGNAAKMIGVAADVYRGKFDTKFNKRMDNANQSRSNSQNTPAKGNHTQAGVKDPKTPPQQAQPKKTPTTVHDYYELTIEWSREHRAIAFIGPLLNEKFHKGKFEELTLPEAQAFYNNLESLVKEAQAKDDEILEKSMA
jgi:hypothetical protein